MNLLSGKSDGVRRWRTADGQEIGKSGLQYSHFCVEGWQVDVCVGLVGRQGMGREVEGTDFVCRRYCEELERGAATMWY